MSKQDEQDRKLRLLQAAAPALLEALEYYHELVHGTECELDPCMGRAAIAAAKGESHAQ